jgi:hypothetical protein
MKKDKKKKKIYYSYRENDKPKGSIFYTTDESVLEKYPETGGISGDYNDNAYTDNCIKPDKKKKTKKHIKWKKNIQDAYPKHPDENLKVIIVGNSTSLLKKEYGHIIDSYDVVIRINKCVTGGLEKYVGKKIDIWATTHLYMHQVTKKTDSAHSNVFLPREIKNVKMIWRRSPTTFLKNLNDSIVNKCFNTKTKIFTMYKRKDNYNIINKTNTEFKTDFKISHQPDTGLITICTALKFFKDITIVGFDFYTDSMSESSFPSAYYRNFEMDGDKKHKEDKFWKKNKKTGFMSKENAKAKLDFIEKLPIKILEKELIQKTEE